jgi:endoglucanase
MDGYNHGTKTAEWGWVPFLSLFSGTYAELTSSTFEGRDKPIMIGETGSTETGGSKAAWVADALGTTLSRAFPKIRAVVWFNWNIVHPDGVRWDWPIESSVATTRAFANAISSSYYGLAPAETLVPLKPIQPLP